VFKATENRFLNIALIPYSLKLFPHNVDQTACLLLICLFYAASSVKVRSVWFQLDHFHKKSRISLEGIKLF